MDLTPDDLRCGQDNGAVFAQQVLAGLPQEFGREALDSTLDQVRMLFTDAGYRAPQVAALAQAFAEGAEAEWSRLRAVSGSVQAGSA